MKTKTVDIGSFRRLTRAKARLLRVKDWVVGQEKRPQVRGTHTF